MSWFPWFSSRWKYEIRGRDDSLMMVRYRFIDTQWGGLYLHHFLRSDQDRDLHDHPWAFTSLILWGGYFEETFEKELKTAFRTQVRWFGMGSINRKRATDAHRVDLHHGQDAWTLIWVSPRLREWGFHTEAGWVPWREYVSNPIEPY